eukprot:TRINITY_DN3774_c0_g1_i2.p1 TRINITY_DN3774_c0_g1~~TRINITY_DN3774_c0_g1_i2.p1  ORF type:complete len:434 (-),score=121.06 TRINITY_DN3774_c0_g1_i2:29-1330(-)
MSTSLFPLFRSIVISSSSAESGAIAHQSARPATSIDEKGPAQDIAVPSYLDENGNVVSFPSFDHMGLSPLLLRGIYGYGFENPSVIQQRAIVPLAQARDVIAMAQSGTGKTGTFSIGVLHRVDPKLKAVQALLMEPTRELAEQTFDVISAIGSYTGVKVHLCIGGTKMSDDIHAVRGAAHVIVGTPGRVCSLLDMGALNTSQLKLVVLDEADKMLSIGFEDDIRFVFGKLPRTANIGLFSATMPAASLELTSRFMTDPVKILVQQDEISLRGIRQYYVNVGQEEYKFDTMSDIFAEVSVSQCVIFCNTRRRAEWLAKTMEEKDYSVSLLHGELPPAARTELMERFRTGRTRVLITTDVLARGIDVQGVSCVVNFDLTNNLESYIHRIGRCGRFGRKGLAINLVSSKDAHLLGELQRFYSTEIPELPQDFARHM